MRYASMIVLGAMIVSSPAVAAKPKDPIKVTGAKSAAALQSVVIASFSVAFINEKTDGAFAGSKRQFKAMGSIVKSKLVGVGDPEFQAVTDAAYTDFTAKLTAAGFTVADRAPFLADKEMAKARFVASGARGTVQFGKDAKAKAVFFAPTAFGASGLFDGEIGGGQPQGIGGIMASFAAMGPLQAKLMYAVTNKQPIVNVVYVVDYADAERYGGTFAYQASVNTRASLAVVETLSKIDVYNAKGALTSLVLAEPVGVGGDFGTLADTTSTGKKIDNVLGSLIGGLGGVGSNTYSSLTFTADAKKYEAGAAEASAAANTVVVARLASLR